jgi:hypothetical protein
MADGAKIAVGEFVFYSLTEKLEPVKFAAGVPVKLWK